MVIGASAIVNTEIDGAVGMYSRIFNNPFLIWGRYKKKWFRYYLPISFLLHHTQMDGAHAGRFLANLQETIKFYVKLKLNIGKRLTRPLGHALPLYSIKETEAQLRLLIARRNQQLDWRRSTYGRLLPKGRKNSRKEMKTMEKFNIQSLPEIIVASHRGVLPSYAAIDPMCYEKIGPKMQRLGCKSIPAFSSNNLQGLLSFCTFAL